MGLQALIRELEQGIRGLQDQVKFMSLSLSNPPPPAVSTQHPPHMHQQHRSSPGLATSPHSNMSSHLPRNNMPAQAYNPSQLPFGQAAPGNQGGWFPPTAHAPLLAQTLPSAQQSASQPLHNVSGNGTAQDEDWDETYLATLGMQDPRKLRELLARSSPEVIMPLNGAGPLSQAVVLTLIHRVSVT